MPGIPTAYIEGSYRGRKVAPGAYKLVLKMGSSSASATLEVKPNPLYSVDAKNQEEWQAMMGMMEAELTRMHQTVKTMYALREQLERVLTKLPTNSSEDALKADCHALVAQMKAWDEEMVQRKSKAYDDVENYQNKFTANYLFLINHTESSIPRVNQGSRDRLKELTVEWAKLEAAARKILEQDVPDINKRLWDAGFGALWKN